ncbi:hypothetical protein LCGC14_0710960 [marine sediment metagenome]|uniref:Uncharacterized protein n=1 Tax=marine sediment metagenome TaxID=412755 RepID=A0A0F9QJH5_9ZZZZ
MAGDERIAQRVVAISAGERISFDIGFKPDTWVVFPKEALAAGDKIYVAVSKRFDGLPLSGAGQLKLPGLGGSEIYIHNAGSADADVYVIASRNIQAPVAQAPISVEGFVGGSGGGGGGGTDYILVQDKKAITVHGGTFTTGAWQTRDINDEVSDPGEHASISANQITLAAGTYRCHIIAPAYYVKRHQTRLQNITDGATELLGTCEYTGYILMTRSTISGRFIIASAKVFEVQHRGDNTYPDLGYGIGSLWTDGIFTVAQFWREK